MQESYKFGYWGETSEEILRARFPLHRACRDGDAEVLSLLLVEAQHGIYEEDNFYGWTPAHWASYFGKLACLRKLLATTRLGVNSNIRTSRFRQTPAHLAAFGGHPQCLLWLVSAEAELSAQDYLGETAVHKAARTGSMECISLLVSHGAKLFICNNNGQTAAQLASLCGYMECSRYLEEAAQCQDNQPKGVYQKTPPLNAITTPSPADVTTSKVHPCVIAQGLNGGRLPPPGPHGDMAMSEDCMMEEDSMEPQGVTAPSAAGDSVTDIMLDHGVSANTIAIGGRKRCREDGEEVDHKRRRSDLDQEADSSPSESMESVESVISTTVSSVSDQSPRDPRGVSPKNLSEIAPPGETEREGQQANTPPAPSPSDHEPYLDVLALPTEPMKCLCPSPPPGGHDSHYWLVFV